jgi:hypothetical protein
MCEKKDIRYLNIVTILYEPSMILSYTLSQGERETQGPSSKGKGDFG